MATDHVETALTSDEALAALELALEPAPIPLDPAVAARGQAALQVIQALMREYTWRPEVEAWLAGRPLERLLKGLGMNMGEPLAEGSRPVPLMDRAITLGQELLRGPRRDRLEGLVGELQAADDAAGIERLLAEVQRVAVSFRQARAVLEPWRASVRVVEDELRQMVTSLQALLTDCERARGNQE